MNPDERHFRPDLIRLLPLEETLVIKSTEEGHVVQTHDGTTTFAVCPTDGHARVVQEALMRMSIDPWVALPDDQIYVLASAVGFDDQDLETISQSISGREHPLVFVSDVIVSDPNHLDQLQNMVDRLGQERRTSDG